LLRLLIFTIWKTREFRKLIIQRKGNTQAIRFYNTAITDEQGDLIVDTGGGNQVLKILRDVGKNHHGDSRSGLMHAHTDHMHAELKSVSLGCFCS